MDKRDTRDIRRWLSRQVSGARYFFLDLTPSRSPAMRPVMGGLERCDPDFLVARESFPFFGLEYVSAGLGSVMLDGKTHALGPGAVFAYAPDTRCEIRTNHDDPLVKFFLSLAGSETRRRLEQSGLPPGSARTLAAHAEITGIFENLVREGTRSGSLVSKICATMFELLLLKIEDTAAFAPHGSSPAQDAFLRCKALIDSRAETLDTLGDIAAATGAEASSLCRWFRRFQGTSPYQYLLRRKMNLAAEHLIENGGLVKEAAARVGFADPLHFSRCFKSVHGIAPSGLLPYRRTGSTVNADGSQ